MLLDILLYIGDSKFRENAHRAMEAAIGGARERSSGGRFVIIAHSLGSAIALEFLVTSCQWDKADRIVLATLGSPIRRFFCRFFPDYMFPGTPSTAAKVAARRFKEFRWVNVYRPFDQIGGSLGFSASCAARDRSTGQRNLVLSAHVNYWSDETVISNLKDTAESAARISAASDFSPAAAPVRAATDVAASLSMLPCSVPTRHFEVAALSLIVVFVWMLVSLWHAAGRVDEKLVVEQEFFGHSSDQVASVIAGVRRIGGFETVEGRKLPVTRTEMYFSPAAESEIIFRPRKVGYFYRRELFDFDAAIERSEEVCGRELILPGGMKTCPSSSIEVRYDQNDPHRFTLPAFNLQQDLSLFGVLWKAFVCLSCALIATVLILLNGWVALIAAAIGAGITPRSND